MSGNLTIEALYEAYDRVWDIPEEPYWYLCHPDDLARLRAGFAEKRWGTCPFIRASPLMHSGKVFRIPIGHDLAPAWQWSWQRRDAITGIIGGALALAE